MDIFTATQMVGQPGIVQAQKAIAHVLARVRDHEHVGYYLGLGSQSFDLLTEAYATLTGEPLSDLRRNFQCTNPSDPREVKSAPADKKTLLDLVDIETMARLRLQADAGDFDLCDQKELGYLLDFLLRLGLDAQEARCAQTQELF